MPAIFLPENIDDMSEDIQHGLPPSKGRTATVSLLILCLCCQAFGLGAIALFLPVIRENLGLSFTEAGTLSASATLFYALMQIPAGYLADRLGAQRLFLIGILGTTTLLLLFGFVSNYWQALINQSASGPCRALLFAPGIVLLTGWFGAERRATAMSLYLVGGFGGQIIVSLVGPILVNNFDWQFPFILFGAIGILFSLAYLRFSKEPPTPRSQSDVKILDLLKLFGNRVMWLCGGIQYVRVAILHGVTFWLPTLLIDEKGLSLQVTGLIIALRSLLIVPSNMAGGYISDRLRNPPLVIGLSLVILAITTSLLVVVDNIALLIVIIAINSAFVQLYFGPLFAVQVEVLGPNIKGTATGFGNFFANLGGLTFAYLLGAVKDATGAFEAGFFTLSAVSIVGLVFTIWLARIRHNTIMRTKQSLTEAELQ